MDCAKMLFTAIKVGAAGQLCRLGLIGFMRVNLCPAQVAHVGLHLCNYLLTMLIYAARISNKGYRPIRIYCVYCVATVCTHSL